MKLYRLVNDVWIQVPDDPSNSIDAFYLLIYTHTKEIMLLYGNTQLVRYQANIKRGYRANITGLPMKAHIMKQRFSNRKYRYLRYIINQLDDTIL